MLPDIEKKIKTILKKLPGKPGVYKFIGKDDSVLYIGKAKDLKKRVTTYFNKNAKHSIRIEKMLSKVHGIEYITVDSELEALILESNLIKELKPRYNVMLKDDKNFVYIKITDEDYPRIKVVRRVEKDGAKYYGPKTSAKKTRKTVEVLRSLFPIRDCDLDIKSKGEDVTVSNKVIKYPCLQHHINTCCAPCINNCGKHDYDWMVDQILRFLGGNAQHIIKTLQNDMQIAVNERRFEDAARVRDKIQSVEAILEKQKVSEASDVNQDVLGYYIGIGKVFINMFIVREGKLVDSENFSITVKDVSDEDLSEVIEGFLRDYYSRCSFLPDSVLLPFNLEGEKLLSEMLGMKVLAPKRGEKHKLVEMSNKNAMHYYKQMMVKWESDKAYDPLKALADLTKTLGIKKKIKRIEGYDISHLGGEFTVGAMVVLDKGEPKNSDYRHFKLKTVSGGDDYGALSEVLSRRLKYLFSVNPKGITVRRGLKKDLKSVEKILTEHGLPSDDLIMKDFVILESKKKIIGTGRLVNQDKKRDVIQSLWVSPKMRGKGLGHVILQALIDKSKATRIYIGCDSEKTGFYEKFGFKILKKVPGFLKDLNENCTVSCKRLEYFVYEKITGKVFGKTPDLVLLDGGKGQLSTIAKTWKNFGAEKIPLIAMDKSGKKVWKLKDGKVVDSGLNADSQPFYLLQRVTDEAHRFSNRLREDLHIKKLTT